jgi:hypothetical protein
MQQQQYLGKATTAGATLMHHQQVNSSQQVRSQLQQQMLLYQHMLRQYTTIDSKTPAQQPQANTSTSSQRSRRRMSVIRDLLDDEKHDKLVGWDIMYGHIPSQAHYWVSGNLKYYGRHETCSQAVQSEAGVQQGD